MFVFNFLVQASGEEVSGGGEEEGDHSEEEEKAAEEKHEQHHEEKKDEPAAAAAPAAPAEADAAPAVTEEVHRGEAQPAGQAQEFSSTVTDGDVDLMALVNGGMSEKDNFFFFFFFNTP